MVDPDIVSLYDVLEIRVMPGDGIPVPEFVSRSDAGNGHIPDADFHPFINPGAVFRPDPVREHALHAVCRADKTGIREAPRPDLPRLMVDMVDMVMCTEKCVDPCHFLRRYRYRHQPSRIDRSIVINADHGLIHFDEESHLAQPPKDCRSGKSFRAAY